MKNLKKGVPVDSIEESAALTELLKTQLDMSPLVIQPTWPTIGDPVAAMVRFTHGYVNSAVNGSTVSTEIFSDLLEERKKHLEKSGVPSSFVKYDGIYGLIENIQLCAKKRNEMVLEHWDFPEILDRIWDQLTKNKFHGLDKVRPQGYSSFLDIYWGNKDKAIDYSNRISIANTVTFKGHDFSNPATLNIVADNALLNYVHNEVDHNMNAGKTLVKNLATHFVGLFRHNNEAVLLKELSGIKLDSNFSNTDACKSIQNSRVHTNISLLLSGQGAEPLPELTKEQKIELNTLTKKSKSLTAAPSI